MNLVVFSVLFVSVVGNPGVKGGPTMRSRRSHPIHIRAEICMSGRRKRGIRDALRVQPEPIFLRIILSSWERAGDDFRLMAVAPAL